MRKLLKILLFITFPIWAFVMLLGMTLKMVWLDLSGFVKRISKALWEDISKFVDEL